MKNIIPEGLEPMTWYVSPVEDIPSSERGTPPVVNFYSYMGKYDMLIFTLTYG